MCYHSTQNRGVLNRDIIRFYREFYGDMYDNVWTSPRRRYGCIDQGNIPEDSVLHFNNREKYEKHTTWKFISIYMFQQFNNACTKYHFILHSICLSLSPISNSNKLLYYHIHIKLNLKSHSFLNFVFIYVVLRQHSKQPLLRLLLSPFKLPFAKNSLAVF